MLDRKDHPNLYTRQAVAVQMLRRRDPYWANIVADAYNIETLDDCASEALERIETALAVVTSYCDNDTRVALSRRVRATASALRGLLRDIKATRERDFDSTFTPYGPDP